MRPEEQLSNCSNHLDMLTNQPISSPPHLLEGDRDVSVVDEADVTSEGCPTPLDWQQVVSSFREESGVRRVKTSRGPIETVRFGEGPPLFMLNGFLGNHNLYSLMAWVFREEHTTIMIDWPTGDDRSRRATAQQRLSQVAGQLVEVADEYGYGQWAVHATSFGCLVALQAMLDFPERITRASLQGASSSRRFSLVERALLFTARRSGQKLSQIRPARFIQEQNNRRWFPPFDGTRWEFYSEQVGKTPLRELADRAALAGGVDLSKRLSEIKTPLLLIPCEGDGRLSIEAQLDIADQTPTSHVESLDNCGSIPHVTHPHRLAKLLRQFRDNGLCCSNDSPTDCLP